MRFKLRQPAARRRYSRRKVIVEPIFGQLKADRGFVAFSVRGLVYATGHHRNGILLTPVSADTIARLVLDGIVDPAIAPFGIERFAPARAAS